MDPIPKQVTLDLWVEAMKQKIPDVSDLNPLTQSQASKRRHTEMTLSPPAPEKPSVANILKAATEIVVPDTVDPWMGQITKTILAVCVSNTENTEVCQAALQSLGETVKNNTNELKVMKEDVKELQLAVKTLTGKLSRSEIELAHERKRVLELEARSMRDNIIIRSTGSSYKYKEHEDPEHVFRKFLRKELKMPNTEDITITRVHRMGRAEGEYNAPLIAKVPFDSELKSILANTAILKGTKNSVSIQEPAGYNERKQFSWQEFKKAKADKKPAVHRMGQLFIHNKPVEKFKPPSIPQFCSETYGIVPDELHSGTSEILSADGNHFQARMVQADCTQDIRDSYEKLLRDGFAGSDYISYAYRFGQDTDAIENFESGGNSYTGLQTLRIMRKEALSNCICFISQTTDSSSAPLKAKSKVEKLELVIKESGKRMIATMKAASNAEAATQAANSGSTSNGVNVSGAENNDSSRTSGDEGD